MEQDTGHYVEYPHPIRAGPGAIDNLAHVNNAIYLMWMQEAIGALWRKTAPLGQVKALTWVAHRHDVVYNRPAVLHDLLIAVVRVTGYQSCCAQLETRFERHGECVAMIKSTMICVDRASGQLKCIRPDLARHFRLFKDEAVATAGATS